MPNTAEEKLEKTIKDKQKQLSARKVNLSQCESSQQSRQSELISEPTFSVWGELISMMALNVAKAGSIFVKPVEVDDFEVLEGLI